MDAAIKNLSSRLRGSHTRRHRECIAPARLRKSRVTERRARHRAGLLITVACVAITVPAAGQWRFGLDISAQRYWGVARERTSDGTGESLLPYRPTAFGISLHRGGATRVGVLLYYVDAGIALQGPLDALVLNDQAWSFGFAPEVSFKILRFTRGPELRLAAGPLVEWWALRGVESRARAGVHSSVVLEVPLVARVRLALRGTIAVTPSSLFRPDEVGERFELAPMWRRSVGVSVAYALGE